VCVVALARRSTPDLRSRPLRRLALCITSVTTPARATVRRSAPERRSPGERRSGLPRSHRV